MKEFFNNLLLYFQFFTRIPINKCLKCEKENFRDGAFFFPVVGLFIGSVQWGIYKLLNPIFPATIIAVIVLIVPVILTGGDRKSTRLNSSHANISYAVFCLKKKKI